MTFSIEQYNQLKANVSGKKPVKPVKKKYKSHIEEMYANQLEARRLAGEIHQWFYEPITFKLADGLKYTIDFMVVIKEGYLTAEIEYIETKGGNPTRSGINKFKQVRSIYKFFKFRMYAYVNGVWSEKYPE